jgi:hypothetical protein
MIQGEFLRIEVALAFLAFVGHLVGDRRQKRECVVAAGDDAKTLAAGTGAMELVTGAAGAAVPAYVRHGVQRLLSAKTHR